MLIQQALDKYGIKFSAITNSTNVITFAQAKPAILEYDTLNNTLVQINPVNKNKSTNNKSIKFNNNNKLNQCRICKRTGHNTIDCC